MKKPSATAVVSVAIVGALVMIAYAKPREVQITGLAGLKVLYETAKLALIGAALTYLVIRVANRPKEIEQPCGCTCIDAEALFVCDGPCEETMCEDHDDYQTCVDGGPVFCEDDYRDYHLDECLSCQAAQAQGWAEDHRGDY